MGKVASSLGYRATKPFREFNLEHRLNKELSRDKRPAAPRHHTTKALIDEAVKEQPKEVKGRLAKKDELLLDRLKSVYVTSQDGTPLHKATKYNPSRPLPSERSFIAEPEFGYIEPKTVPYGRVTLRSAVEAITRHQEDPVLWTPRRLAIEHKLSVELTEKVLRHFRMFTLVVPPDPKKQLSEESLNRTALTAPHTVRHLPPPPPQDKDKDKGKDNS